MLHAVCSKRVKWACRLLRGELKKACEEGQRNSVEPRRLLDPDFVSDFDTSEHEYGVPQI